MLTLKFFAALWAAKCIRAGLRLLGRNATYLPGYAALKICPAFLSKIGKPDRIIAVTGTNGKTTVANLLGAVLSANGRRVLDNRLGSNVAAGIASSLVIGASLFGKPRFDTAVFEVDERSSARILPFIKPEFLVITNLFRDSVMRNAHPEYIAGIIGTNVPSNTKLVLNADDLISASIAPKNPRVYFALAEMDSDVTECVNRSNDVQICPLCRENLIFDYRRYHHIGRAHCPKCGFSSPASDYTGCLSRADDGALSVSDKSGEYEYALLSDSIHNIYNMVTVAAALREFGLTHSEIAAGFSETKIIESRYSEDREGPVTVVMHLAKAGNSSANSRAFDYVSGKPGDKELILMNNLRDHKNWSENVCWLYDADFEFLTRPGITRIVLTGPRTKDYYLRLLFAGVDESKIKIAGDDLDAPALLELKKDSSVFIFYGTDTIGLARQVRDAVKTLARTVNNEN